MVSRPSLVLAALAFVALVAVGWISDHSTRAMSESLASMDRTRQILLAVDVLRADLAAAESSARGHVLTELPAYIGSSERAEQTLRQNQRELNALLAGDARHRASLAALGPLIDRRIALFRELGALGHESGRLPEVRRNVVAGTNTTARIGAVLNDIRAEETDRFRHQMQYARNARWYALYGPWLMCGIAAIIFGFLGLQISTTLRRGDEARRVLRDTVAQERAAVERAQESDKLKNQFLAAVSHDLRTPLTAILGWCELMSDRTGKTALMGEGLANIAEAARTQSHLVEDLLDVSRIAAGKLQLRPAEVDPIAVIERAVASLKPAAHTKEIAVRTNVETPPFSLVADATRLEQIVSNLLSNAIKFTWPGGTIDVTLRRNPSRMLLVVRDDGEGIERELLPHVFDRFRQGRSAMTRQGGLGLGLSIVKHLVELHGGEVRAKTTDRGRARPSPWSCRSSARWRRTPRRL